MSKRTLVTATLVSLAVLSLSNIANAAANGFYVGGQLGYGNTNYSEPGVSIDKTGLAGRASVGYQFCPNLAGELGYTKFNNTKGKSEGESVTLKQHAFDLTAKGMLPFGNGFNAYGVLGAAWMRADAKSEDGKQNRSRILPTFGIGLSYDITPQLPVDISWRRIQKIGSTDLKSADLYSVGVSYHFG